MKFLLTAALAVIVHSVKLDDEVDCINQDMIDACIAQWHDDCTTYNVPDDLCTGVWAPETPPNMLHEGIINAEISRVDPISYMNPGTFWTKEGFGQLSDP